MAKHVKAVAVVAPAMYEHEVRYARWWAYLLLGAGVLGMPAAVVCAIGLHSWPLAVCLAGGSMLMLSLAYKRLNDAGPQVKFGPEGIWTAKLGFQPWQKVRADVGLPPGTTQTSATLSGYVLVYDRKTGALLDQLDAVPLDMELDLLRGHLRYYSNQK